MTWAGGRRTTEQMGGRQAARHHYRGDLGVEPGPRLVGHQLWGGDYLELLRSLVPREPWKSPVIGLACPCGVEEELLRVRNLETEGDYGWYADRHAKTVAAEQRSRRDAEARRAAEERARAAERRMQSCKLSCETSVRRGQARSDSLLSLGRCGRRAVGIPHLAKPHGADCPIPTGARLRLRNPGLRRDDAAYPIRHHNWSC